MGQSALLMGPPEGLPGSSSSSSFMGDYSAAFRATPTPLRTPVQEDIIMQEARNARVLRGMNSPVSFFYRVKYRCKAKISSSLCRYDASSRERSARAL